LVFRLKTSLPFHTYSIDSSGVRRFLMFKRIPVSINSKSNNSISSHADGYTIDGDRVNIILAASGSGKSHYNSTHPWFRDADLEIKWPEDKSWKLDPQSVFNTNIGLWQQLSEYKGRDILMYNGVIAAIPKHLVRKFNFLALVHIEDTKHHDNLIARTKNEPDRLVDMDKIFDNKKLLYEYAKGNNIPIFGGFHSAVSHITHNLYSRISKAYKMGHTILNCTRTALKLVAPDGVFRLWDSKPEHITFGSHVSMRIHTNEYARFTGYTQHKWRHETRNYPMYVLLDMLGFKPKIELTICGHISKVMIDDVEMNASGHMLGMFTWLAFPHERVCGMPQMYPDFHTYITMYMLNQSAKTPSLEPYNSDVSYHRWVETLAGLAGSVVAVMILLKKGLPLTKRNLIMWRLSIRKAVRMIRINDRTWYMNVERDRNSDKRFGPVA